MPQKEVSMDILSDPGCIEDSPCESGEYQKENLQMPADQEMLPPRRRHMS
jgi:hypothetical protein